ncbi:catalytic activity protein, partial [Halocaridina rubra]
MDDIPEPANGPDQILPASYFKTWEADKPVTLYLKREGPCSTKPISIHTMVKERAINYPNQIALAVKRDGAWKYWTYKEYFDESRIVAKAFIRLGLEIFHGVCIMGFNSPEWMLLNFGVIFAGGLVAGVYTTNSPEACRHLADNCRAQIVVVEDVECLNKFLAVKRFLPQIKAIIQWSGIPGAPGVLSWAELMAIGMAEKDMELEERLSLQAVNQCCTLIYTS